MKTKTIKSTKPESKIVPTSRALYKVIIQKMVYNKRATEENRAAARRVVIVTGETVDKGVEHLRDVLEKAGAFKDSTGEIVTLLPAGECVTLMA